MEYINNPMKIENKSMDIIDENLKKEWTKEELPIVRRIIHTTGDFQYEEIISMDGDFINKAIEALKSAKTIYSDTKMIMAGINKGALKKAGIEIRNYLDDEEVIKESKETGVTRSSLAMEKAIREDIKIFVIGNAPTALFTLLKKVDEGFKPDFIIGVPVGFVGAKESKELLSTYKNIPHITTLSTKGGSNVAASIVNALLYMIYGR